MKRKLPQWLIDATSQKRNTQTNLVASDNNDSNSNNTQFVPEQHSNSTNAESDHVQSNGRINVVPLANLLTLPRSDIEANNSNIHVTNNMEIEDIVTTGSTAIGTATLPVVIKTEQIDQTEPGSSSVSNVQLPLVKQEIKDEPVDSSTSTASSTAVPPTMPVPKVTDVKPERRSCNYGIKCYRRNADHRSEMAHPGDIDYRRPNLPTAPIGTPPCPWGAACYRRNPQHFMQLSHPPATNTVSVNTLPQPNVVPQSNPPSRRNRTNARNYQIVADNDSDAEDDYDLDDPFIDNGSSDEYEPDGDGSDDDDEDDLQDTQELTDDN